jgi:hypothetical protein
MSGQGMPRPVLAGIILLCVATVTSAGEFGIPLGDLHLSFDPNSKIQEIDVTLSQEFSWYVIASVDFGDPTANGRDGIISWEALVDLPPEITVLSRTVAGDPLICGDGSCGDDWNLLLSTCLVAEEGPFLLVHYSAELNVEAQDLEIRLLPPTLSEFDGTAPGWAACSFNGGPEDLHPFATGWSSTLIINSSVKSEKSSWSAVKARY